LAVVANEEALIMKRTSKTCVARWLRASTLVLLGMAMLTASSAATLEELNAEYIGAIQLNYQTTSQQLGLVNTIDRLLDCSAAGMIEVDLIGLPSVPEWVAEFWTNLPKGEVAELTISRFRMALDQKHPAARTDFYRFRVVQTDDKVVEHLIQDIRKDKKAALIFRFVNGDPTGYHKNLSDALEDLLSAVEEGSEIAVAPFSILEVPQRVHDLWVRHAVAPWTEARAERFTAETPGGAEVYWRVESVGGTTGQTLLINRGKVVYNLVGDKVVRS
jgi:hypothetical protein